MTARAALAGLAAAAALAGLSALTRAPYATRAMGATLRLSWRVRGEEVERCRRATAAELAGVPAHMRQEVVCEGRRVAPYRLRAEMDGRAVIAERAPGSDLPGDRPMYLLRDLPLAPGAHRIAVRLEREGDAGTADDSLDAGARRRRAIPARLAIDTTVSVRAGTIALVTYDSELRRLVLRTPGAELREAP